MKLTVIGGCGAYPGAGQPCSGYLVDHDGFGLLIDPGYGVATALSAEGAPPFDAVLVSHGHPDHCADLNPLLRARVLAPVPLGPLPVWALPGSLDAVLALDRAEWLVGAIALHTFLGRRPLRDRSIRGRDRSPAAPAAERGLPHFRG